ncbi:MAG: thiamine pyrophosphate-dependent enzyme [Solirubrobacterales bacterium]
MAGPGHPPGAIGAIGAVFGEDAVYTVDGGNTSLWAYSVLPPTRPSAPTTRSSSWGCWAPASPRRSGAKLGAPERGVVCVSSDGTASFNVMEMQTAARERLPITVIVMAEGSWTMEEISRLDRYGRTFGTQQGEIRWDLVAQGLGCHSEYVDRIEDLDAALRRARAPGPEPRLHPQRPRGEPLHPRRDDDPFLRGVPGAERGGRAGCRPG